MRDYGDLVIIRVDGGICSQIAFVALGEWIVQKFGWRVKYDLSWYRECGKDNDGNLVRNWDFPKAFPSIRIDEASVEETKILAARHSCSDFNLADIRPPMYFCGYANRKLTLWKLRDWIRGRFQPAVDAFQMKRVRELRTDCVCAVHVRRGDLSHPDAVYGKPTSVAYYARAMQIVAGLAPDIRFSLFSDDSEWTLENVIPVVPKGHVAELVEGNGSDRGYLDLHLIAQCEYIISSAGSFGFFGALLSDRCKCLVVSRVRNDCFANLGNVIYLNDDREVLFERQARIKIQRPLRTTISTYRLHECWLRFKKRLGLKDMCWP